MIAGLVGAVALWAGLPPPWRERDDIGGPEPFAELTDVIFATGLVCKAPPPDERPGLVLKRLCINGHHVGRDTCRVNSLVARKDDGFSGNRFQRLTSSLRDWNTKTGPAIPHRNG